MKGVRYAETDVRCQTGRKATDTEDCRLVLRADIRSGNGNLFSTRSCEIQKRPDMGMNRTLPKEIITQEDYTT